MLFAGCYQKAIIMNQPNLKVAFPHAINIGKYDPALINYAYEYIFLENTYSPLVEMNKNGVIVQGIAEYFEWKDNDLHLKIRKKLLSGSGKLITAQDAAVSLKRLLILGGNTHGNLKSLLCAGHQLKNLNDTCSGIKVLDDELILSATEKKSFLISMLSAIDFAVIPADAIDPATLKIIDYRNTSGPYYIEHLSKNGENTILKANPNHYRYSKDIPQVIELTNTSLKDNYNSVIAFDKGEVDLITTIDPVSIDDTLQYAKQHKNVSIHSTQKILLVYARFTKNGFKKIDPVSRRSLAQQIKAIVREYYHTKQGYEDTDQYFATIGEGGLDKNHEKLLNKALAEKTLVNSKLSKETLKLRVCFTLKDNRTFDFDKISGFNSIKVENGIWSTFSNEHEATLPDLEFWGVDTGFLEDVSMLSYLVSADNFGIGINEGSRWLDHYMSMSDKAQRIPLLKELHYKALSEFRVIPITIRPYVAMARKPWKMDLPDLFANNPFWMIHYQE